MDEQHPSCFLLRIPKSWLIFFPVRAYKNSVLFIKVPQTVPFTPFYTYLVELKHPLRYNSINSSQMGVTTTAIDLN